MLIRIRSILKCLNDTLINTTYDHMRTCVVFIKIINNMLCEDFLFYLLNYAHIILNQLNYTHLTKKNQIRLHDL